VARDKNKEQTNKEQALLCVPRLHPSLRDGRGEEENRPSLNVARGKNKEQTKHFLLCFSNQKAISWGFASQNPSPKAVFICFFPAPLLSVNVIHK